MQLMMVRTVLRTMANVPGSTLKETRRWIYSKPPRNKIGAAQSFFVMSVFTVVMLTPAAWILHHLPEYRQRSRQNPKT
ncbi:hypothetical protein D4764_19G0002280 [Takifugu flavidus]|uniref:Uncharacterized protein n=1 Tax=Takifugu flavidus TaxID=433684 RepID=A0A5C6NQK8_9TELE|nr:hypothetical protein D4764_19G0002280 [Takifugu flavidus]